jgi:hypothetical protein
MVNLDNILEFAKFASIDSSLPEPSLPLGV